MSHSTTNGGNTKILSIFMALNVLFAILSGENISKAGLNPLNVMSLFAATIGTGMGIEYIRNAIETKAGYNIVKMCALVSFVSMLVPYTLHECDHGICCFINCPLPPISTPTLTSSPTLTPGATLTPGNTPTPVDTFTPTQTQTPFVGSGECLAEVIVGGATQVTRYDGVLIDIPGPGLYKERNVVVAYMDYMYVNGTAVPGYVYIRLNFDEPSGWIPANYVEFVNQSCRVQHANFPKSTLTP